MIFHYVALSALILQREKSLSLGINGGQVITMRLIFIFVSIASLASLIIFFIFPSVHLVLWLALMLRDTSFSFQKMSRAVGELQMVLMTVFYTILRANFETLYFFLAENDLHILCYISEGRQKTEPI